jgi:TonB-linked SusC/RagA family outer membrane protein
LNGEYASNPNAPLFILDGFETSLQKVIDLDIYRIASITLLKDAASKAIYGSRAANGVLVIETLRPQGGKLQVSYSNNINIQLADVSSYNLLNATQKLEAEVLAGVYRPSNELQSGGEAQFGLKEWYSQNRGLVEQGVNTDWLAKPLRNGIGQRHSLRLEGGDENMRYGVDVSNNNLLGVMKGSDRKTTAGALDLSYRKDKVIFTNILSVTNNKSSNSPWGDFSTYAAMNPYLPYYDENGMIAKVINTTYRAAGDAGSNAVVGTLVYNPAYNSTLGVVNDSKYTEIRNNFSGEYRIFEGFMTRARFNVIKQYNTSDLFLPANHTTFTGATYEGDNFNRRGRYTKGNGEINNFSGNLFASYNKPIGRHLISSNIGVDYNHLANFNNTYAVEGFPNDRMDFVSSALQYVLNSRPTGTENTVKDMSVIGAANYSYDDRYAADFSFRSTQSSNFGANARWGQFWSLGAVWNAHRESFIQDLGFIDRLTFRASTGYTGSQNLSSSLTLATYTYILENAYLGSGNGATLLGLANPDLQWQRKLDNNFGMDVTVLQNKFNLRFDYYTSLTNGLITDITLPPSSGFASYKANLGQSQNKGYDLRLNYLAFNQPAKRTSLSFNVTLSHNKNILKNISSALQAWNSSQDAVVSSNPKTRFIEGQSMSAIWAVQSLGIDPATGREVYLKPNGEVTYTWNAADQIAAGESLPKYTGNFGFSLQWSGFQLNTSFRYQLGGSMYNQTLVNKVENADIYKNVDARVLTQRWRQPGDVSSFKNIADRSVTLASTRFLVDNNILTMAALNLQYDLAEKVPAIKKWGIARMRPGLSISDQVLSSSIAVERGTSYPFSRNFQFSLQVSFN